MKPLRLELSGFTCFKEKTDLSFEELSLFAISGATGSGKSSILDAMVYALYGQTPRLGGRGLEALMNPQVDELYVIFEFEVGQDIFRVVRHMRRQKTKASVDPNVKAGIKQEVRIEQQDDAANWKQLPEVNSKEIAYRLTMIVGLDYDSFVRAVLLPQGAFDEFLRGSNSKRIELLIRLLGLEKITEMQKEASARSKSAKEHMVYIEKQLEQEYQGVNPKYLQNRQEDLKLLLLEKESIDKNRLSLNKQFSELEKLKTQLEELSILREKLSKLKELDNEVNLKLKDLAFANIVSRFMPLYRVFNEKEGELKQLKLLLETNTSDKEKVEDSLKLVQEEQEKAAQELKGLESLNESYESLLALKPRMEQLTRLGGTLALAKEASPEYVFSDEALESLQKRQDKLPSLEKIFNEYELEKQKLAKNKQDKELLESTLKTLQETQEKATQELKGLESLNESYESLLALKPRMEQLTRLGGTLALAKEANSEYVFSDEALESLQKRQDKLPSLEKIFNEYELEKQKLAKNKQDKELIENTLKTLQETQVKATQEFKGLESLNESYESLLALKPRMEQLTRLGGTLALAKEASSEHVFSDEALESLQKIEHEIPTLEATFKDIKSLSKQQDKAIDRLELTKKEMKVLREQLEDLEQSGSIAKEQYEEYLGRYTKASLGNRTLDIKKDLEIGDICPICENPITKLSKSDLEADFKELETQYKLSENKLTELRSRYGDVRNKLKNFEEVIITTQQEHIDEIAKNIADKNASLENLLGEFPVGEDLTEETLNKFRGNIDKKRSYLLADLAKMISDKSDGEELEVALQKLRTERSRIEKAAQDSSERLQIEQSKLDKVIGEGDNLKQNFHQLEIGYKALETELKAEYSIDEVKLEVFSELNQDLLKQRSYLLADLAKTISDKSDGEELDLALQKLRTERSRIEKAAQDSSERLQTEQSKLDKVIGEGDNLEQNFRQLEVGYKALETELKAEYSIDEVKLEVFSELNQDLLKQRSYLLADLAKMISDKSDGEELEVALQKLRTERSRIEKAAQDSSERLQTEQSKSNAIIVENQRLEEAVKKAGVVYSEKESEFNSILKENNIESVQVFLNSELSIEEQQELQSYIDTYNEDKLRLEREESILTTQLGENAKKSFNLDVFNTLKLDRESVEEELTLHNQKIGAKEVEISQVEEKLERSKKLQKECKDLEEQASIFTQLNQDLQRNHFPEFLLTTVQEQLAFRASKIMRDTSEGRYDLQLRDGEYFVIDGWHTGELRNVKTLSGGETFMASLSLALALSETVAGHTVLGALFLDEGFGTLDSDTLGSVATVLEALTEQGRMVGIITHVAELSERMPDVLHVVKGESGSQVKWSDGL